MDEPFARECCVPTCRRKGCEDEVSFHPFPPDTALRRTWLATIRREGRRGTEPLKIDCLLGRPVVCSGHFPDSDFLPDAEGRRSVLGECAIPSIFAQTRRPGTRTSGRLLAAAQRSRDEKRRESIEGFLHLTEAAGEQAGGKCDDGQKATTESTELPNAHQQLGEAKKDHHLAVGGRTVRIETKTERLSPADRRLLDVPERLETVEIARRLDGQTCSEKMDDSAGEGKTVPTTAAAEEPYGRRGSRVRRKKQFRDYAFDCWISAGRRHVPKPRRHQHPPRPESKNGRITTKRKREANSDVDAESTNNCNNNNTPVRRRSALKVLSKSPRFQNETLEEEAERLSRYAARYRRYMARETDEQRERRLQRGRELRQMKKLGISPAPRARPQSPVGVRRPAANSVFRPPVPPSIDVPASILDPEEIFRLQREYVEFKEYVRQVMPKDDPAGIDARERKAKSRKQRAKRRSTGQKNNENAKAASFHSSTVLAIGDRQPQILYSDDPIDQEIALLETAEETFVPVQVINQTCEDFDHMLEFEIV